jgi:PilZ domain/Gram-negative bacterial TonB protein C-terminal
MLSTRESIRDLFQNLSQRRDRRASTRSNSPLVTYIDLGDGNGGIALNISEGGLAITAAGMLFADYFPTIRFQLPKIPGWIETSGRVAWVGDSRKAAGISFEGITEVDRERIRHWINSQVADDEIEQGISYLAKNSKQPLENSTPPTRQNRTTPRKLEVLSKADEARFAAMFPSESTLHLQKASAHDWTETEVEHEVEERVGQDPGEFLEDIPTPQSVREDSGAEPVIESSVENTETLPQSVGGKSEIVTPDADVASDAPSAAVESVDTIVFPRRRWIIDRPENVPEVKDETTGENAVAQLEAVDPFLDQDDRFSDEDKSTELSLPEHEESQVIQESPKESIPAEEKNPGEWALPTFTYPGERDWRQQFDWSREPAATQPVSQQAAERVPERRSLPLILGLGIVVAAICFVAGLMSGNGSIRRLLRFNGYGEIASSTPAISPGTNSGNSNQIVERAAEQRSSNSSSNLSTNTSISDSHSITDGARPAHPAKAAPQAYPGETPKTGDDLKAPANNSVQEAEDEVAPSEASSSSDSRKGSSDISKDLAPDPSPYKPAVPETRTRPQSSANGSQQSDYETTVDKPYSEVRSPILVTPPDEKSGPFRLAFPEVAVSASGALAISAQRFVLVPTLPGPASAHRPARLQAGVLIYHVDPVPPAGSDNIGGTVKVRATIGKGGDVVEVRAVSGPTSLIPRVVRAVREWRYTVTLLDGQPLGAEEDVVMEFRPRR